MEKFLSKEDLHLYMGELNRSHKVSLVAAENIFTNTMKATVNRVCKGEDNVVIGGISHYYVDISVRHSQLYVEVIIEKDFTNRPEVSRKLAHVEEFVFTKKVESITMDDFVDCAETVGKAIAQIALMDCLSYVTGKDLEREGWILDISQPEILHLGRRA
jgi:hypothetical protein